MLQPSFHSISTFCPVTVNQSLVESILEHGWNNNRISLGLSACKMQAVEQVFFAVPCSGLVFVVIFGFLGLDGVGSSWLVSACRWFRHNSCLTHSYLNVYLISQIVYVMLISGLSNVSLYFYLMFMKGLSLILFWFHHLIMISRLCHFDLVPIILFTYSSPYCLSHPCLMVSHFLTYIIFLIIRIHCKIKLSQLPVVEIQKVPGSFCSYYNHSPNFSLLLVQTLLQINKRPINDHQMTSDISLLNSINSVASCNLYINNKLKTQPSQIIEFSYEGSANKNLKYMMGTHVFMERKHGLNLDYTKLTTVRLQAPPLWLEHSQKILQTPKDLITI
ncbi:hypothetical protein VP01_3334g1 [Puccinia sorghi]|uniref:Uncharacterized protein n=1 Tax=Puccinia sorghi TaxID=27349 RepID=A0A0L6UZ28_9BASI|nr:hypothetical protein VP01_3334g1 [Puccinia sorghi]